MTSRVIPVEPFVLVVFGATGDLSRRKLIPAMFQRDAAGQLPEGAEIFGVSRSKLDHAEFVAQAKAAVEEHVPQAERPALLVERFLKRLHYVAADATGDGGWAELAEQLKPFKDRVVVFYLATGPALFGPICERLGRFGLADGDARVVVEKPVGKDGESAHAVNEAISRVFPEDRVYRIDHYLGKETVQNLMALRFANGLFEPLWNAAHIDHVQITVAESLGVEGRAGYYDTAGALRDMVQNHILQLLCLVAMEPPAHLAADAVRDEKLKVLRALQPAQEHSWVRGQYRAGASAGGPVPGYLDELGAPESQTETFVALKAEIGNWRWAGVPFYLRTGKRLAERVSEIVITFRPVPHSVFGEGAGPIQPNRLVIRLQPDEGVKLWLMIKDPGPGGMRLRPVPLDMSFAAAFNARNPDAYERLVLDVVRGNQTLFMRRDEVEAAWAWIDPILEAWSQAPEPPKPYTAGTWGPSAAIALIERDGRTWADGAP
ncbi:glucose-6-phosphate dehydrogenase [Acidocella aminolytica]|jgi:glucose-6-phosphate 1-dehydrogenase|uniref:Glucose-6-phosphate 1-dehydrogenase n=1 Tax=Acidocella aminolytica 101 = DSM 11237 TaxID=1120923 RepID=A0A0D6PKC2_9PROT|nr:glucose-6-phosphate dehydrogenase [Acidocella aminolytica]GAN81184.1 glucose-6-phosphate 1-dehydrogenase [Acidocella aminolytica 101 = DSM 11237]SHF58537.1 glucose-6-phosphate 1-dehydrogenase [Acidocella aminolytica 101 = DSM 11237]